MDTKKRDRRDRLQNLLIVLLSLSAMLQFVTTQSSTLGLAWNPNHFSDTTDSAIPGESGTLADLATPIHVAVGNSRARFGQAYTTTANTELSRLATLMGSALGSAKDRTPCPDAVFRAALDGSSICFDFTVSLPVLVLAELLGMSLPETEFSARILVLAMDEAGSVQLYLQDGDGNCYVATPALYASDLESALSHYEPNGAVFAYEWGESYAALDPYTLLPGSLPVCPELRVGDALSDKDTLLRQLGFNPHTPNHYPDAAGTETVIEISRTLRLQTDGTVHYSSDGDTSLTVAAVEQLPTLLEAVTGVRRLAEQLTSERIGEAQLYLTQVTGTPEGFTVRFGLHRNGVPIRYAAGAAAAEFVLSGPVVTDFSIHLRQYTATEQASPLLPLRQAAAVAQPDTRLTAAYLDDGSGAVPVCWLAD